MKTVFGCNMSKKSILRRKLEASLLDWIIEQKYNLRNKVNKNIVSLLLRLIIMFQHNYQKLQQQNICGC